MREPVQRIVFGLLVLLLTTTTPAQRSFTSTYDSTRKVTLEGPVTKVDWVNPHIYLHLDVKGDDGQMTTWALGTVPTAMARKGGLTRESIAGQPGEVLTIECNPARDGTKHLGWVKTITFADGRKYELSGR
jgi:hypothetical protein